MIFQPKPPKLRLHLTPKPNNFVLRLFGHELCRFFDLQITPYGILHQIKFNSKQISLMVVSRCCRSPNEWTITPR